MKNVNQAANHLSGEQSPYLLQHVHNPVDWYPWGAAAFEKAKTEDKPIFLSIGYSTCHWCHVMAHESFEDEAVAAALNAGFISIKVDREERPDIDNVYMAACQAATGSGGWPMTIIMTPDGKPFFAGTYLPKSGKWGRPGLLQVLESVQKKWQGKRQELLAYAEKLVGFIQAAQARQLPVAPLTTDILQQGFNQLEKNFDAKYGGFGKAPKFPTPHNMLFLLQYYRRQQTPSALAMVRKTLDSMHAGGIYDHVGYGFSRYAVDEKWVVPHFEKMLYDNALLAYTYLEVAELTGERDFGRLAEEIIGYVLRELAGPAGEFYSAEDADSEAGEGRYYTWTMSELGEVLGTEKAALFAGYYNATDKGNFEHGANILHTVGVSLADYAAKTKRSESELTALLEDCRKKLLIRRNKRQRPFRDDKVLTAWNALMAATLAKAFQVLDRAVYRVAAEKCLAFVEKNLRNPEGRLLAAYRGGEARHLACIDDYAFLLWARLELQAVAPSDENISRAIKLADEMVRLFWDDAATGFYFSGSDGEVLPARMREWVDAAIPAGNSVAARMLCRLSVLSSQPRYREISRRMLSQMAGELIRSPLAYTFLLAACEDYFSTTD
jgi:uncharacterized protein YyaL (SSP411 family)